jgi:hypothetical protein
VLPKLKTLGLDVGDTEGDLSPLTRLTDLNRLILFGRGRGSTLGLASLAGMTRLRVLQFIDCDADGWFKALSSAPPSLAEIRLDHCVVPPDHHAFSQFDSLEHVSLTDCRTPDGTRITTLDIPGVRTEVK